MEPLNLMVSLSHQAEDKRHVRTDPIETVSDRRTEREPRKTRRESAHGWLRAGWRGVLRVATR